MSELNRVELTLENCEFVKVPVSKISYMSLEGITRELTKHYYTDNVTEDEYCSHFNIEIKNPKEIKAYNGLGETVTVYEMLTEYPDITVVTLVYEDGSEEDYRVEFSEGSYNDYQYTKYDEEEEELSIIVDKDFDSEDYPN